MRYGMIICIKEDLLMLNVNTDGYEAKWGIIVDELSRILSDIKVPRLLNWFYNKNTPHMRIFYMSKEDYGLYCMKYGSKLKNLVIDDIRIQMHPFKINSTREEIWRKLTKRHTPSIISQTKRVFTRLPNKWNWIISPYGFFTEI